MRCGVTYSSKSNDLAREPASDIFRDAIEVKHKLRERFPIVPLPLSNGIHGIRRSLLGLDMLHLRLAFLLPSCDKLLLECARVAVVRSPREEFRLRVRVLARGGASLVFHVLDHLLLRRWLSVRDLHLSRPSSFNWQEPCPVWRIGCIRHVCEWTTSRHGHRVSWRRGYKDRCPWGTSSQGRERV